MAPPGEPHPHPRRRVVDIDVGGVAEALDDNDPDTHWWYDPTTGRVEPSLSDDLLVDLDENESDQRDRGLVSIEPSGSRPAYLDMVDFTDAVGDAHAAELLARALDGRGAFRRFRDTLDEFDDLRQCWLDYTRAAGERRAIDWLADEQLVTSEDAENERAARTSTMNAARAAARPQHAVTADDLVDRWNEISELIDDGLAVTVTRDGQPWASINPAAKPD